MSYPYPRISKMLNVEHCVEGVSPRAKEHDIGIEVEKLVPLFVVPAVIAHDNYAVKEQIMFILSYSVDSDFYITNLVKYFPFVNSIVAGGFLTVEFNEGFVTYRYKLLGHSTLFFAQYTNQKIKKDFTLTFYGDDYLPDEDNRGILQEFKLRMSGIYEPSQVGEVPEEFENIDITHF